MLEVEEWRLLEGARPLSISEDSPTYNRNPSDSNVC
jgi:hypothetical protein